MNTSEFPYGPSSSFPLVGPYTNPLSVAYKVQGEKDVLKRKKAKSSSKKEKKKKRDKEKKKKDQPVVFGCDACGKQPLTGCRYNCTICKDYDLCVECFASPEAKHVPHMAYLKPVQIPDELIHASSHKRKKHKSQHSKEEESEDDMDSFEDDELEGEDVEDDEVAEKPLKKNTRRPSVTSTAGESRSGHGKRTQTTPVSSTNAIDKATEILIKVGIHPVPHGKLGSKAAQDFNSFVEVGWSAFCDRTADEKPRSIDSASGQIICLNAMPLAGLPHGRVEFSYPFAAFSPLYVKALLLSIIAQIEKADVDEWFLLPVPTNFVEYHQKIKHPMDLDTLKQWLLGVNLSASSLVGSSSTGDADGKLGMSQMLAEYVRRLALIWTNAMKFNPPKHIVHITAAKLARASLKMVSQTIQASKLADADETQIMQPLASAVEYASSISTSPVASGSSTAPTAAGESGGASSSTSSSSSLSSSSKKRPRFSEFDAEENGMPVSVGAMSNNVDRLMKSAEDGKQEGLREMLEKTRNTQSILVRPMPETVEEMKQEILDLREAVTKANYRISQLVNTVELGLGKMYQNVVAIRNKIE